MTEVIRFSRLGWLSVVIGWIFAGCATPPPSRPEAANLVSDKGIGPVKLGMTASEVKSALGSGYRVVSPAKGNTLQLAGWHRVLNAQGEEIFRFFVQDWQNPDRPSPVIRVRSTRPEYRTAEGVGAGVAVASVSRLWGEPLLSRRTAGLGVERLSFARQPRFLILEARADDGYAGIYPRPGPLNLVAEEMTKDYWPGARVYAVTVAQTKPFPSRTPRPAALTVPPSQPSAAAPPPQSPSWADPAPPSRPAMRTRVSAE